MSFVQTYLLLHQFFLCVTNMVPYLTYNDMSRVNGEQIQFNKLFNYIFKRDDGVYFHLINVILGFPINCKHLMTQ